MPGYQATMRREILYSVYFSAENEDAADEKAQEILTQSEGDPENFIKATGVKYWEKDGEEMEVDGVDEV